MAKDNMIAVGFQQCQSPHKQENTADQNGQHKISHFRIHDFLLVLFFPKNSS